LSLLRIYDTKQYAREIQNPNPEVSQLPTSWGQHSEAEPEPTGEEYEEYNLVRSVEVSRGFEPDPLHSSVKDSANSLNIIRRSGTFRRFPSSHAKDQASGIKRVLTNTRARRTQGRKTKERNAKERATSTQPAKAQYGEVQSRRVSSEGPLKEDKTQVRAEDSPPNIKVVERGEEVKSRSGGTWLETMASTLDQGRPLDAALPHIRIAPDQVLRARVAKQARQREVRGAAARARDTAKSAQSQTTAVDQHNRLHAPIQTNEVKTRSEN